HGRFYNAGERVFGAMLRLYDRGLRWVLRRHALMLIVTLATIGLTIYLYVIVPKGLFPQQDTGQIMGFSDAPQDISFPAMRERQERANAVVLADPDVNHMLAFLGAGPGGGAVNTGTVF